MKHPLLLLAIKLLFIAVLFSCKPSTPRPTPPPFERMLQDTTKNYRAKWDLDQLKHYNGICKGIGLSRLYDGVDSFEVRVWRQFSYFGASVDEEIYSLKFVDTAVQLTYYRVYCTPYDHDKNYNKWEPFTDPKIDSFVAKSITFPKKLVDSVNLPALWNLKTQSALHIPDSIGFLDGGVTSIELASNTRYKLIRYHEALSYYQCTKIKEIGEYIMAYDKLRALFQSHKVFVRFY